MKDKEIYIKATELAYSQSIHYQTQRTTVNGLLFSLAAFVYGFVAFDKSISIEDVPILIFHIIISIFGALFSAKYHQKYEIYHEIYKEYLTKSTDEPLSIVREDARNKYKMGFFGILHIWHIWVSVHLLLALLSGFVIFWAVVWP